MVINFSRSVEIGTWLASIRSSSRTRVYCGGLNNCSGCDMMLVWFGLLACKAKSTIVETQFKFSFSFFNIFCFFSWRGETHWLYFFLGVGSVGHVFIYIFATLWVFVPKVGPNNCMLALDNGWVGPLPDFTELMVSPGLYNKTKGFIR